MTNSYIAFAGGIMSFIGLIIILNYAEDRTFFAFQGMILGAVFLGLGVVVIAISAIVTDNKKSLYFCKHCKFAAAELADLYNHSVKEHDDENVEGIEKEVEDELDGCLIDSKSLPKESDEKLEEVKKLKTRNPYKAKGVIIGLIFVILFIPFFIVGSYFVANITFMVTDKMSPLIEENDWVHKSDTPISEINYNDIIFYTSSDKLMVNKVVGIIADERVDYIFTVKNTASPTIKKVTENQYVGKMDFIVGNFGEYGKIMLIILNFIFFPQMIILLSAIGFIVPIIVMRHRAKINV